jgi:hypothetical protein
MTVVAREFSSSNKRPQWQECAKSGHSQTAWQRAEIQRSGPPMCFQRRSNALMSTWGMAVVRDFRTAACTAPLAADERPVAVVPHGQPAVVPHGQPAAVAHGRPAVVAPHGQPVAVAHGQPAAVAHGRPVAVAPHAQPAAVAPHAQPAAVAHGRQAAVAPHEQLGEVGEPMVAAAGHGRPAPLGKARER